MKILENLFNRKGFSEKNSKGLFITFETFSNSSQ